MSAPLIRPVSPFAAATLIPVPLLILGGLFGGVFILAAVLYMTVLRAILDAAIHTSGTGTAPGVEFPAADPLSKSLVIAHFLLLLVGVAGLSGATGLGFWEGVGVLLAFGLFFGQVSNSNAHELIHRTDKRLFQMGKWVLISLLYGHHVTAHLRIHHRHVATPQDPNSAELGENFYYFVPSAWIGAFIAGYEIEQSAAKLAERELPFWRHPYAEYIAGSVGFALAATLLFGASGLIAYLLLAFVAQLQLLMSDYVQHYGLQRRMIDTDRFEPVSPWHSWNGAQWFSGGLMLNAPRHSEHHTNPARPYAELSLPNHFEGPRLPYSLPTMGAIALIPPLWRKVMDGRAASWQRRIEGGTIQRSRPLPPLPAAPGKSRIETLVSGLGKSVKSRVAARKAEAALNEQAARPATGGGPAKSKPALPPERIETDAEAEAMLARLAAATLPEDEPAEAPEPPEGQPSQAAVATTRSSALWSEGEDESGDLHPSASDTPSDVGPDNMPEAATQAAEAPPRFIRSSALFQPDGEDEAAGPEGGDQETANSSDDPPRNEARAPLVADAPEGPLGGETEVIIEGDLQNTISDLLAGSRKDIRRRRAKLPALDPDGQAQDPDGAGPKPSLVHGASIAARAVAALLRGAPEHPRDPDA